MIESKFQNSDIDQKRAFVEEMIERYFERYQKNNYQHVSGLQEEIMIAIIEA